MRWSLASGVGTKLGLELTGAPALQRSACERVTTGGAVEFEEMPRMFSHLMSSAGARGQGVSAASWSASTAAHVLVLLLAAAAASRLAAPFSEAVDRGEVTYLHIAEPEAPAVSQALPEAVPEPPPAPEMEVAPEPVQVTPPDQLAGFQELLPPREVTGIPDPSSATLVDPADFRGRGVLGGVAGGRLPLPGETIGEAEAEAPSAHAPMTPEMLFVQPRILNLGEVGPGMEDLYPDHLHAMGVEGRVMIEFVVNARGRVESETVKFVESTHPGFEPATRALLALLRWAPGQHTQGQAVPSLVMMPVEWTINKKR